MSVRASLRPWDMHKDVVVIAGTIEALGRVDKRYLEQPPWIHEPLQLRCGAVGLRNGLAWC